MTPLADDRAAPAPDPARLAELVRHAARELRRLHSAGLSSLDMDYGLLLELELAVVDSGWPA